MSFNDFIRDFAVPFGFFIVPAFVGFLIGRKRYVPRYVIVLLAFVLPFAALGLFLGGRKSKSGGAAGYSGRSRRPLSIDDV